GVKNCMYDYRVVHNLKDDAIAEAPNCAAAEGAKQDRMSRWSLLYAVHTFVHAILNVETQSGLLSFIPRACIVEIAARSWAQNNARHYLYLESSSAFTTSQGIASCGFFRCSSWLRNSISFSSSVSSKLLSSSSMLFNISRINE